MVGVYDAGRIHQVHSGVQLQEQVQVLVVVIGHVVAVLVHRAPEHGVGQLVSRGGDFPAPVSEGMGVLGRIDGIEHHGHVAAGGIFHAGGHIEAAGGQAVLLVLHRAGADGHIGQDVGDIAPVLRIEHFVRGGEPRLLYGANMHLPHGDEPCHEIGLFLGIGLVDDALVALPGGAGLVGVDSGNQYQLVLHLVVHLRKAAYVVADGVLVVCGTGADDDQELVASPGDDVPDLRVPLLFCPGEPLGERVLLTDLVGSGQFLYKFKTHGIFLCRSILSVFRICSD